MLQQSGLEHLPCNAFLCRFVGKLRRMTWLHDAVTVLFQLLRWYVGLVYPVLQRPVQH